MGFHWPRFHKPEPAPVRYVVATKQESRKAQERRTGVLLELAVYNATTSLEQRKAETEAFFSSQKKSNG